MSRPMSLVLLVALLSTPSLAAPSRVVLDPTAPAATPTGAVCSDGRNRCHVHVRTSPTGEMIANAAPVGWGARDLEAAYLIAPATAQPATVAIVVAYGYPTLDADLAAYRAKYGLPACTRANGCLRIVNQSGDVAPLPGLPPPTDDWTIETALDVDMVSAGCPTCDIVVVQAQDNNDGMYVAQLAAVALGATVINNSWGRAQQPGEDLAHYESYFDHPGIATFVSSGDAGYNEGGLGPHYPSTSAYTIAVGGTRLTRAANARGFAETAWSSAGSSCSLSIPKPNYQQTWPCPHRATTDLSAVADPQAGVAIYNSRDGGWLTVGGTSAASPLVASIFAATGHGSATGDYVAHHVTSLFDVTSGSNGSCGTALCTAGPGWDGPTGFGTPNAAMLAAIASESMSLAIDSPEDGATVHAGFDVAVAATGGYQVELRIDGALVGSLTSGPFVFHAPPSLVEGAHEIAVTNHGDNGLQSTSLEITLAPDGGSGGGGSGSGSATAPPAEVSGGCSAAGPRGSWLVVFAVGLALARRRRAGA